MYQYSGVLDPLAVLFIHHFEFRLACYPSSQLQLMLKINSLVAYLANIKNRKLDQHLEKNYL